MNDDGTELQKCLGALVGDEDLPVSLSHLDFADKVLGFQDYAEEDEDQPVEAEETQLISCSLAEACTGVSSSSCPRRPWGRC